MFVRYFVELEAAFDEAEPFLLRSPRDWLAGLAQDADERGQRLLIEVGFPVDGRRRIDKRVEVDFGEPIRLPSKSLLPMSWKATGSQGLFPALEGDLEIAPLGARRTQLALSVRYRPPLGAIGRVVDKTMLHRVAEATVKDFLDRTGQALAALIAAASRS